MTYSTLYTRVKKVSDGLKVAIDDSNNVYHLAYAVNVYRQKLGALETELYKTLNELEEGRQL